MDKILGTALQTLREARTAEADALAALDGAPAYVRTALKWRNSDRDLERLGTVLPLCPTSEPLPDRVHPHESHGTAVLEYAIPAEGWRERIGFLRERHPPVPLVCVEDGSKTHRPASFPSKRESEKVTPIADYVITADKTDGYPHTIEVVWWSELAPGILVRIACTAGDKVRWTAHPLVERVRYTLDNPPKSDRARQHPEDRKWSVAWTWGSGSTVTRWWTPAGNPPRRTWTWNPGTTIEHALSEGK